MLSGSTQQSKGLEIKLGNFGEGKRNTRDARNVCL